MIPVKYIEYNYDDTNENIVKICTNDDVNCLNAICSLNSKNIQDIIRKDVFIYTCIKHDSINILNDVVVYDTNCVLINKIIVNSKYFNTVIAEKQNTIIIDFIFRNYYEMLYDNYLIELFKLVVLNNNNTALKYILDNDINNKLNLNDNKLMKYYYSNNMTISKNIMKQICFSSKLNDKGFHMWFMIDNIKSTCLSNEILRDSVTRERLNIDTLITCIVEIYGNNIVYFDKLLNEFDILQFICSKCTILKHFIYIFKPFILTKPTQVPELHIIIMNFIKVMPDEFIYPFYENLRNRAIEDKSYTLLKTISKYAPEKQIIAEYKRKIFLLSKILPSDLAYHIMKFAD